MNNDYLHEAEMNNQVMLADRSLNPNPRDVHRLYDKWRLGSYGSDNGKGLFEKLQQAMDTYNSQNENDDGGEGQAVLQWYDAGKGQTSEVSVIVRKLSHQQKKKITSANSTPMILAPIVRRAHQYVQQSRDVAFIDATSSFDRQNTLIFVLLTVTPGGYAQLHH